MQWMYTPNFMKLNGFPSCFVMFLLPDVGGRSLNYSKTARDVGNQTSGFTSADNKQEKKPCRLEPSGSDHRENGCENPQSLVFRRVLFPLGAADRVPFLSATTLYTLSTLLKRYCAQRQPPILYVAPFIYLTLSVLKSAQFLPSLTLTSSDSEQPGYNGITWLTEHISLTSTMIVFFKYLAAAGWKMGTIGISDVRG